MWLYKNVFLLVEWLIVGLGKLTSDFSNAACWSAIMGRWAVLSQRMNLIFDLLLDHQTLIGILLIFYSFFAIVYSFIFIILSFLSSCISRMFI
jgi:hypothetical protein